MPYTSSQAQAGRGSSISIGPATGSPPALTLIGEVTDLPLDLPKWDTADVTNLESGMDSESLPTIRKASSFTVKGNRVSSNAGQLAAIAAYNTGTLVPFSVALLKSPAQTTAGDSWTFNAYVLSASFTVSPTKEIEFSMDLMSSGAWTFTEGS